MDTLDLELSLPAQEAAVLAERLLMDELEGELMDSQEIACKSGRIILMLCMLKSLKSKGMLTLLVTIDSLTGSTRLHAAGAGQGLEEGHIKSRAFTALEETFSAYNV